MAILLLRAVSHRMSKPKITSWVLGLLYGDLTVERQSGRGTDGVAVRGFQDDSEKEQPLCCF